MSMMDKFLIYKLTRAPRRIKRIFYIYWNRLIFSLAGVKYGKNMRVYNKFYLLIHSTAKISIGKNFAFTSGDNRNPIARNIMGGIFAEKDSEILIGDNVGISASTIRVKQSITIKDNVKIGADSIIIDTDAHNLNYCIRRNLENDTQSAKSSPITIENDVLIGARCIILKGVTIGARSVIGAGSVVSKSIPEDSIAAGNPCKVIRAITNDIF